MHHSSVSWEITLLYFFSWSCTGFGEKEPTKVQNYQSKTVHIKFHQIFTFIGSFCWKYKQFQLRKYRGLMSHDPQEWHKIWRKSDLLFQKWQKFGEFWPEHWKVSNICTFIGSYYAKYLMFNLKKYRRVIFHDTKEWCKIWRKTELWFDKWHEKFGKFLPEHLNGTHLSKVEHLWA